MWKTIPLKKNNFANYHDSTLILLLFLYFVSDKILMPYKVLNPAARKFRKKVRVDGDGDVSVRLNTYSNAWLWDGKPKMQTNAYYGR